MTIHDQVHERIALVGLAACAFCFAWILGGGVSCAVHAQAVSCDSQTGIGCAGQVTVAAAPGLLEGVVPCDVRTGEGCLTETQAEYRERMQGRFVTDAGILIGTQFGDLLSTELALSHGHREANPIMSHDLAWNVAAKTVTTVGTLALYRHLQRTGRPTLARVMVYVVSGTVIAVSVRNAQMTRGTR